MSDQPAPKEWQAALAPPDPRVLKAIRAASAQLDHVAPLDRRDFLERVARKAILALKASQVPQD